MRNQKVDPRKYIKVRDFAQKLGVHPKSVLRWIREDEKLPIGKRRIPAVKFGSRWFIPRWFAERHGV